MRTLRMGLAPKFLVHLILGAPCLAFILSFLASGCQPRLDVIVTLNPPPGTDKLEVLVSLDGIRANEMTEVSMAGMAGSSPFSFVLALPPGAAGRALLVRIGARDPNGCLFSRGFGRQVVSMDPAVVPRVEATWTSLARPVGCGGQLPVLIDLTPVTVPTSQSTMVHIEGWGMQPQTSMAIDGYQLPAISWDEFDKADVAIPSRPNRAGPVELTFQDPTGASFNANGALFYHFSPVSFADRSMNWGDGQSYVFADLNGDGLPDFAWIAQPLNIGFLVYVAINQGGGLFSDPSLFWPSDPGESVGMAAGDIDGDGRIDLVILRDLAVVTVLLNAGDASFPTVKTYSHPVQLQASGIMLADLAHDGNLDIVLPVASYGGTILYSNVGHGDLKAESVRLFWDATVAAIADLNGDGFPDLIGTAGANVLINLNQGSSFINHGGTYFWGVDAYISSEDSATAVVASDLDGDGALDLTVAYRTGMNNALISKIFLNQGAGTFLAEPALMLQGSVTQVVDLNGDQLPDLWTNGSGDPQWYEGTGHGQFAKSAITLPNYTLARDLNGDGKVDLFDPSVPLGPVVHINSSQ